MTPILYEYNETSFTTNGIGRLSDTTSCIVTEERNGEYELAMEYPEGGQHANDIEIERIIWAKPAALMDPQPFRIYKITKPLNQLFKVYAHHISYDLNYITVNPCGPYLSNLLALQGMVANANGIGNFVLGTVGSGPTASFSVTEPASFRNWIGGREGSILDTYGGELEWDKFTIKLLAARGINRGLVLRYGKNITDISKEQGIDHTISGVCPFMRAGDGSILTLQQHVIWRSTITQPARAVSMDFSQYVDEQAIREAHPDETDQQINYRLTNAMQTAAEAYVANELPASPQDNIEVSFVNLGDTEEYKDMAALFTQAALCDTVTIVYPRLDIQTTAKIIKTEYNVLQERFEKLTIGKARATLGDKLTEISDGATTYINNINAQQNASSTRKAEDAEEAAISDANAYAEQQAAAAEAAAIAAAQTNLESAISENTDLITGVDGGYIRINRDNNGKPFEILIMDDPDVSQAVKVWRWNINGLGYSSTGYNGPYTSALSMAGIFNTDFIAANTLSGTKIQAGTLDAGKITTGYLDASIIKTNALTDRNGVNSINMQTGAFSLANGNFIHAPGSGFISLYNNLSLRLDNIPLGGKNFVFKFSTDSYYQSHTDVVIVPSGSTMRITIGGMNLLYNAYNNCTLDLCTINFTMYPYMLCITANIKVTGTPGGNARGFAIYGGPRISVEGADPVSGKIYIPIFSKTENGVTDGTEIGLGKYFGFSKETSGSGTDKPPSGFFDHNDGIPCHEFVFQGTKAGSYTTNFVIPTTTEIVETIPQS